MKNAGPQYAYADLVAYALSVVESIEMKEHHTCHEAITSWESSQWILSMNKEIESLPKNLIWKLVEKPKNQKIVGCKWVFKRKKEIPGMDDARFKARIVVKGYT